MELGRKGRLKESVEPDLAPGTVTLLEPAGKGGHVCRKQVVSGKKTVSRWHLFWAVCGRREGLKLL